MHLNRTSEWKFMTISFSRELPLFNFKRLGILLAWIGHSSEKLLSFQFLESFHFQFQASRYIIGLNRTSESKGMAIWICLVFPCLIFRISIYYAPESNIWVKSYDHLNFLRAFLVQFQASRYIVGLNHTYQSIVMAVWISLGLPCLIFSMSIYYAPESHIWLKSYDLMGCFRASVVQFQTSQNIIGLNRTSESKVMAVLICLGLPRLISSILIYYAFEFDIRVKSYDHLVFSRAPLFNFKRLNILLAWIGHPSQKLWPIEFALRLRV